jgi:hypothetical protein
MWGATMAEKTLSEVVYEAEITDTFGSLFVARFGDQIFSTTDPNKLAAHELRVELYSRVTTQRLAYGSGVEKTALESIVSIFETARGITVRYQGCDSFATVTWFVLNTIVRPFTAKWHPISSSGGLTALDASDDFREELTAVQKSLRQLEYALRCFSSDAIEPYDPADFDFPRAETEQIVPVQWRPAGDQLDALGEFGEPEKASVEDRRAHYGIIERDWATGIALSGGGIRSATFALGVLSSIARHNLLPDFDYLSTVSGGGYAGCFLTSYLGYGNSEQNVGLRHSDLPFQRTEQESQPMMGIRQRARYLSSGFWERITLVMRSVHGIFVNFTLLSCFMGILVVLDYWLEEYLVSHHSLAIYGLASPFVALLLLRLIRPRTIPERWHVSAWNMFLGFLFVLPLAFAFLRVSHIFGKWAWQEFLPHLTNQHVFILIGVTCLVVAIISSTFVVFSRVRPAIIGILTVGLLVLVEVTLYVALGQKGSDFSGYIVTTSCAIAGALWLFLSVNQTSLHDFYRAKLASAFIFAPNGQVPKISAFQPQMAMYPIVNCAFNAPNSSDPLMRGRLAEVFSFTPHKSGSNLAGFATACDWEEANPRLDLASMMAISGAAVSPQMGLRTTRLGSFWLTLFNLRLGLWVKNPMRGTTLFKYPQLEYLWHEFTAGMTEKLPFAHLSDGGHIENLGVYELLRRRCRFILAVDGESDPQMTFHALTNLQRLAFIDFGIKIEPDLDDLRLSSSGFSRSHFRFCRIYYPSSEKLGEWEIGYLLYVKLSLTGNEGEFIRRYRFDEPAFPHQSTLDQFFSETQFEAYRSLGEHVGEKLFMKTFIGDLPAEELNVANLMSKYASAFP